MKNKNISLTALMIVAMQLCVGVQFTTLAQEGRLLEKAKSNKWDFEVRAGFSIGGPAPIPMPNEIRKIESYDPYMNGMLETVITKWLDDSDRWGVAAGLRLEQKGMHSKTRVKNYHTSIEHDGTMEGNFTGLVNTHYSANYITLPVKGVYRINDAGRVSAGLYVGYRSNGAFDGYVSDGYLRKGNPTGEKILFEEDNHGSYNFQSEMNHYAWGFQIGGSWHAYKHFLVFADLKYDFTPVFKSSFDTITFDMNPIYLTAGFSYLF